MAAQVLNAPPEFHLRKAAFRVAVDLCNTTHANRPTTSHALTIKLDQSDQARHDHDEDARSDTASHLQDRSKRSHCQTRALLERHRSNQGLDEPRELNVVIPERQVVFVQATGQLVVTADGLEGFIDTEDDKLGTEIVGQEPQHVQEPALLKAVQTGVTA